MAPYRTGLWALYGLTKMLSNYSGSAIRVRRSNDDAEQNIGFTGTALDTAALATFVGANSAFVTTWYDQSGNSNNMLQATTARQPRIVNAGVYDGKLVFNPSGLDDSMATVATSSASTPSKTIFRRVNDRAHAQANNVEFVYGDPTLIATASGANQIQANFINSTSNMSFYLATDSGAGYRLNRYAYASNGTANGIVFTKAQTPTSASIKWYAGGSLLSEATSSNVGSVTLSGNFPGYTWGLGGYPNGTFGAKIDMWNCAIYDADKSADALAINAVLGAL